jgi:hypothetical protein
MVDEGTPKGGKSDAEFTRAVSDLSADVPGASSSFACCSAGRRVGFCDLGVAAFAGLRREVVVCSNGGIAATAIGGSRPSAG